MAKQKTNYEEHRERLLKKTSVKKLYEEEMSKYLAEEAAKIVEDARKELNTTYRRLRTLLQETA
jgi:hypothetical protein